MIARSIIAKYVCTIQVLQKCNTFLLTVSALNLRSFMDSSTCYVCLYIASAKKNLHPVGTSRQSMTGFGFSLVKAA